MAEETNIISQVVENVVIIERIIKFCKFAQLKSLRQINSFWNEVVTPKLFKKSVIILRTSQKSKEALEYFGYHTKHMKHKIKELHIIGDAISFVELREVESRLWNNILGNISIHVEKLVFSPRNLYGGKTTCFIPKSEIKFPNVVQLDVGNYELDIAQIYPDFYSKFPNLKELIISHLAGPAFVLSPLVNIEDGSRIWALAPNLNSLTNKSPMSLNSLQLLVDFPQKWKKLDLALPNNLNDRSPIAAKLELLLEQNKCSLICLKLRDYQHFNFKNVPKRTLKFPKCFPHLQELEIAFPELNYNIEPINYCNMFPSLNTLFVRLVWIYGDKDIEIWKIFFPQQICRSVKILKMDVRLENLYSLYLQNQDIEKEWHSKMFPNARVVLTR